MPPTDAATASGLTLVLPRYDQRRTGVRLPVIGRELPSLAASWRVE